MLIRNTELNQHTRGKCIILLSLGATRKIIHQHWNESQTPNAFLSRSRIESCISENKSKTIKIRYFFFYAFASWIWNFLLVFFVILSKEKISCVFSSYAALVPESVWEWNRKGNWAFVCTRTSNVWPATFINLFYHFFPFFYFVFKETNATFCSMPVTNSKFNEAKEWMILMQEREKGEAVVSLLCIYLEHCRKRKHSIQTWNKNKE